MNNIVKKLLCAAFILVYCTSCYNTQLHAKKPVLQSSSPVPMLFSYTQTSEADKQITPQNTSDTQMYKPINYNEQKSVWISYIDLQPMLTQKSEAEFTQNISQAYDDIKQLGCNTVYVHTRSFGDAYYNSELFPTSKDITGTIGEKNDFDPLEIMITQAHKHKLSFHAWINPMRCETPDNMEIIDDKYLIKQWYNDPDKYDEYMMPSDTDGHYWLNPAIEDVRRLICNGAAEIVENYNVDGIHIDDYFYPTTDTYFDSGVYVETGVKQPLDDWRRDNVSKMVKGIYDSVKSANPSVLFGVSPQGNIENNLNKMYADVKTWCSEKGYLDYIVPQIYFGYDNSVKPFEQTAADWSDLVTCDNVSLVIGLGIYKIGEDDEFSQTTGIIGNQIETAKGLSNYSGVALYNYNNMFEPKDELIERTNDELEYIEQAINKS